jgi:hypothetical protein
MLGGIQHQVLIYAAGAKEDDVPLAGIPTSAAPEGLGFDIKGRLVVSLRGPLDTPASLEFVDLTTMTTELTLHDVAGSAIAIAP